MRVEEPADDYGNDAGGHERGTKRREHAEHREDPGTGTEPTQDDGQYAARRGHEGTEPRDRAESRYTTDTDRCRFVGGSFGGPCLIEGHVSSPP